MLRNARAIENGERFQGVDSPDWRLIPSYNTTNIPAYGASRNEDAKKPRNSSEGPSRAIDMKALVRLVYAYILL
jgi:hypothetical protein